MIDESKRDQSGDAQRHPKQTRDADRKADVAIAPADLERLEHTVHAGAVVRTRDAPTHGIEQRRIHVAIAGD